MDNLGKARALAVLVPAALLGGAYISQYVFGLPPCEMCWWQRYPHFAALGIGLLAFFMQPARVWTALAGLAIITSGVWTSGASGAALSAAAFEQAMPGVGGYILTLALVVFAFTTILGWSYFGEKCWEYMVGTKSILPFRILWVVAVPFGAIAQLDFAWLVADTLNGLMAIPNLLSLLLLSPIVVKLTKDHFAKN